ncbi:MAG: peptide ABC transporter substrate-binding protein [Dehalococcoidales bacterium]|nr:peptide ABC transporter substrate-binding protein [Dehalococcoidales bacterium]
MRRKSILLSLLAIVTTASLILTSACTSTPKVEQILTLNLAAENNTIDPNRASWVSERSVIIQVFDGLLAFDEDLALVPMVAKQIPTVANNGISADGTTYTIELRTDVTWSDGQKVTANDFVFSLKRLFDPDLACEYASFYFNIVGGEAYYSAADKTDAEKAALKDAIGVRAVDNYTLEIRLTDALPTFPQLLALWPSYPIRQDMVDAHGEAWAQPDVNGAMPYYITNGPFILTEWVQQDHYTFIRNEHYWGTKPKLDKIIFKEITDANVALAAYQNNELDQCGVPGGTEQTTMDDPVLSPQIVRFASLTTYAFQFNVTKPPFDNKLLRQALACAIDRDAYITNVRHGVGAVALSWIPPGMPGFDATLGQEWTFDVDKAKELLAQAGYPNGEGLPELKFQIANTGANPTIAAFLQEQLKVNLDIDLTVELMESKAYSALYNAREFTWGFTGWGADYPDPDNWLPQLYMTGAGNNKTGYSNPDFDALATQALKELDNTKRLKMWADAQALVVADQPMIYVFNRETFVLSKSWVKNLVTTGMDGNIAGDTFLRNVYIQK